MLTKAVITAPPNGTTITPSTVFSITPSVRQDPTVAITAPASGASLVSGTPVTLTGTAADALGGALTGSWSSDKDGAIGSGNSRSWTPSTTGAHVLTFTATDSQGDSASVTRNVTVAAAGGTAPTVTMTSPASGATITAGAPFTIAADTTDATAANYRIDGGSWLAMDPNGTNKWTKGISLTGLGSRTVEVQATGPGGTAVTPARSFTIVSASDVIGSYVAIVNGKRAALSQPPLGSTQIASLEDMWARLSDRDGEMGVNVQPDIRDLFILLPAYNVGAGTELVGIKGSVANISGASWGADGMVFAGGTQVAKMATGLLTGLGTVTLATIARGISGAPASGVTENFCSQQAGTMAGGISLVRMTGTADKVALSLRVSSGYQSDAGNAATVAMGTKYGTAVSAVVPDSSGGVIISNSDVSSIKTSSNKSALANFTVADIPFCIGNNSIGDRGLVGTVAVAMAMENDHSGLECDPMMAIIAASIGISLV